MSIRGRNHGISKETPKNIETEVSFMLRAESYIHMFGLLQASGWIHSRASLWYVNYTSIKLFNKIEPVPATFRAYDSGLDGQ